MPIVCAAGARPNFMSQARRRCPEARAAEIVPGHTGQHYDQSMKDVFFDELGLRPPDGGWVWVPALMPSTPHG